MINILDVLTSLSTVDVNVNSATLNCQFQLPTTISELSCMVLCSQEEEKGTETLAFFGTSIQGNKLSATDKVSVVLNGLRPSTVYNCTAVAAIPEAIWSVESRSLKVTFKTSTV